MHQTKKFELIANTRTIKRNQKLEAKFFDPFQVLHLIKKQIYELELLVG